jgi:hypothetical protein
MVDKNGHEDRKGKVLILDKVLLLSKT